MSHPVNNRELVQPLNPPDRYAFPTRHDDADILQHDVSQQQQHTAYDTSGVYAYREDRDAVSVCAHMASMQNISSLHSQTLDFSFSIMEDLPLPNPTPSTTFQSSGMLSPPFQPTIPPILSVIMQNVYGYTTEFSQQRYSGNFARVVISFRRIGTEVDGISIGRLFNGGSSDLVDASRRIHVPDSAGDRVASIVLLRIMIPGCDTYTGKIHLRRQNAGIVTVAHLARQIARRIDSFLKTVSGVAWARANNLTVNEIILLDFHRVSQGSWQVKLGSTVALS